MSQAYRITVGLSLVDEISPALRLIGRELNQVEEQTQRLRRALGAAFGAFPGWMAAAQSGLKRSAMETAALGRALGELKMPPIDMAPLAGGLSAASREAQKLRTALNSIRAPQPGLWGGASVPPSGRVPGGGGGGRGGTGGGSAGGHGGGQWGHGIFNRGFIHTVNDAWMIGSVAENLFRPSVELGHQRFLASQMGETSEQQRRMEEAAFRVAMGSIQSAPELMKLQRELLPIAAAGLKPGEPRGRALDLMLGHLPEAAQMDALLSNYLGEAAGGRGQRMSQFYNALRAGELLGLGNKPTQLHEFITDAGKAMIASGGRLQMDQIRQLVATAGSAGIALDPKFLLQALPELAVEQGGSKVGTMLVTFMQSGAGRMTLKALNEQERLGLVDPAKVQQLGHGKFQLMPGAFTNETARFNRPDQYALDTIGPAILRSMGISTTGMSRQDVAARYSNLTGDEKVGVIRELAHLFSDRNAQKFMEQLLFHASAMERFTERMQSSDLRSVSAARYEDPSLAILGFQNAWTSLRAALFDGPELARLINPVSDAMNGLAYVLKAHPTLASDVRTAGFGLGGVAGGLMALGGAVKVVTWTGGGLVTLAKGIGTVGGAMGTLGRVGFATIATGLTGVAGGLTAIGIALAALEYYGNKGLNKAAEDAKKQGVPSAISAIGAAAAGGIVPKGVLGPDAMKPPTGPQNPADIRNQYMIDSIWRWLGRATNSIFQSIIPPAGAAELPGRRPHTDDAAGRPREGSAIMGRAGGDELARAAVTALPLQNYLPSGFAFAGAVGSALPMVDYGPVGRKIAEAFLQALGLGPAAGKPPPGGGVLSATLLPGMRPGMLSMGGPTAGRYGDIGNLRVGGAIPSGGAMSTDYAANLGSAVSTLRGLGWEDVAIGAGAVANALGEGGFASNWKKSTVDAASFGPWQFNFAGGEGNRYVEWLRQHPDAGDPKSIGAQAKFLAFRMEQLHPGFSRISDPAKANLIFERYFERHAGAMGRQLGNVPRAMQLVGQAMVAQMHPQPAAGGDPFAAVRGAPGVKFNSKGQPYSATLETMSAQERANQAASYAYIRAHPTSWANLPSDLRGDPRFTDHGAGMPMPPMMSPMVARAALGPALPGAPPFETGGALRRRIAPESIDDTLQKLQKAIEQLRVQNDITLHSHLHIDGEELASNTAHHVERSLSRAASTGATHQGARPDFSGGGVLLPPA